MKLKTGNDRIEGRPFRRKRHEQPGQNKKVTTKGDIKGKKKDERHRSFVCRARKSGTHLTMRVPAMGKMRRGLRKLRDQRLLIKGAIWAVTREEGTSTMRKEVSQKGSQKLVSTERKTQIASM